MRGGCFKTCPFTKRPLPMTDNPTADSPFGAPATPIDPFQAAKASAMKAAEELRSAAAQKASESVPYTHLTLPTNREVQESGDSEQ